MEAENTFLQQTGDPVMAHQIALRVLENLRHQQALSLAYFDCFWLFAVLALALVLLVPFMKRSVAEKGGISLRNPDRGTPRGATTPTPPGIRVHTTAVR